MNTENKIKHVFRVCYRKFLGVYFFFVFVRYLVSIYISICIALKSIFMAFIKNLNLGLFVTASLVFSPSLAALSIILLWKNVTITQMWGRIKLQTNHK